MNFWEKRRRRNVSFQQQLEIFICQKRIQKAAAPKALSDSEFQKFMEQLAEGMVVTHKIFGQGAVVELNEKKIRVDFDGEVKTFSSRVLAGSGMLRL